MSGPLDFLMGLRGLRYGYDADTAPPGMRWAYEALAPTPGTTYGELLPVKHEADGRIGFAMPNSVREGLLGIADLMSGLDTGELTGRGAASMTTGAVGTGLAMAPRGSLAAGAARPLKPGEPPPIKAYHGSPHSFDKFDFSKIGTGEGAQAYGHGFYFAEAEPVARNYRDTLAKGFAGADGATLPKDVQTALEYIAPKYKASGDYQAGVADAIERMRAQADFYRQNYGLGRNLYDSALERLQAIDPATLKPAGHMYEVAIHADPARFLDWDKPLSGQSKAVQNWFDQFPMSGKEWNTYTGGDMYRKIGASNRDAAQRLMQEANIPGIRYLDQGSRSAGQGTSNYVVFPNQDEIIEILRKYGMSVPSPVGPGFAVQPPGFNLPNSLRRPEDQVY